MMVQNIISLFLFMTYASSAPSGCIESCTSYLKQHQTQISGDLLQTASHLQGLDYSRPGTWSEHNEYNVDNGQGKVHEERGQYITGPKTVRYYKKNYSSSYSTRYPNSEIFPDFEYESNKHGVHLPTIQEVSNSRNTYNRMGNSESVGQYKYNKIQNQQHTQSSYTKSNVQNERLEDLGQYSGNSQVIQQGASNLNTQISRKPYDTNTQSGNWSSVNSYKTDGGRGRVFEEDGQYVSGAQKVRYYKRNYTSNYSSSDGIPIPEVTKTGIQDIQQEMEKFHKEIGKGFNQMSTADVIGSSNIGQTYVNTHDLSTDNINSDNHRGQNSYRSSLSTAHTEEHHSSHITNDHLPYRNPYQNTYDGNSYGTHEKHEEYVQKPINQLINPTSGYTSVLTGNSGYNRNTFSGSTLQQQADNFQQAEMLDAQQSRISQTQTFLDNLRNSAQSQSSAIHSSTSGVVPHYKEHWSASHIKETSIPQHSIDITHTNQQSDQYTNNQYDNRHNLYQGMQQRDNYLHQSKESGFTSGKKTLLQKLVTGTDTVDCDYNSHSNTQYQTKYKRSAKYDKQDEVQTHSNFNDDFTQQTGEFDDLTQQTGEFDDQQTSGKPEFNQESQLYQSWTPYTANQQSEHITQQTTEYDDLTQQTSGKLEFGQQSQQFYQSSKPHNTNQQLEDFTQKTEEHNDFTQQTSRNLELGQELQQSNQSWTTHTANQQLGDFIQQIGEFDDLTQQTSGKLEFGQQSQQFYQSSKPHNTNQQLEDFTQKTGEHNDFTQQISGNLELGQELQQSNQSWTTHTANQQLGDFIQQTGEFDDLTQQTSGKLEFGEQSQQFSQPWKLHIDNQELDDLTQKTRDDLTERTSGKFEFGQQSQQDWIPHTANQQLGLTQQTGKFDDLTQQTREFDDLTQQTSRNHELQQESQKFYQLQKPHTSNQELDNLTEKTRKYDDLTQQTSGKVEFGQQSQQSHQARDLQSTIQQLEDLIQKTKEPDNLAQQSFSQGTQQSHHSWNLHNTIQQLKDLIQKTRKSDDFTQQTSGKLEFGQQSQQFYQSSKPHNTNQQLDLTQQTSGKLEFGQQLQQPHQPWISRTADQEIEDFTQKTGELNDFTQQTSGNLELGEDSQFHQSQKLHTSNQELDDLTEKTRKYDDFTQKTSGKVEFGQQSQQSHQAWDLQSTIQQLEDLIKKTKESDNNAQQSFSHEHETTQQSHHSWNLHNTIQQLEDLIQKTRKSDDFTQQTSGKLEFGQESQQFYQSEKPYSVNQQLGSFTQKTESDDITQQSLGKLMFGQESEQSFSTWKPSLSQQSEIFVQPGDNLPKPAEKPKPRSRYSRLGSTVNPQLPNQNQKNINLTPENTDVYKLPPEVTIEHDIGNDKNQNIRGDQGQGKDISNNLKPQTGSSIYDNVDPVNWLHKSNDATVGLQWHYTYHPSDRRQFVQQTEHKNKESLQQQSTQAQFSNLQQNFNQETQNKYIIENSQQESQNYASEQGIKSVRKPFRYIQQENKLVSNQQITENGNVKKDIETASSELKPRILEVYGGGQYDPTHSEDIYSGVTVNPSATLPPESNTDPWDIREIPITTTELTPPPLPVEPLDINDTTETPRRLSVWSRIGHKITTTFDKAKEKAKNIFG
ncbi:tanabin-like isoform X4 [Frieseomelitta varia]|uniref:tanabin-like isoform X3 n=1 Tax=Frieseomelitta varia TaxID=561572 RepID=UPI001CB69BDA|nr:tanabin-like isoform X3 [Frieseomelitta varia]XP_043520704.1 tanabin-like isoform X4 [Frieseomelitta varia]